MVAEVIAAADGDSVTDHGRLMSGLRVLRQREMLRIAWRDLNGLADVALILQELTDFSEAIVAETLHYLEKQQAEIFGMPLDADGNEQSLLVYAMGKMGGGELNFSSDIDLIFTFPDDGETTGRRHTSHYEFYVKVIRNLVKVLDEVTADGFVYRVDIRLRPFGQSGPMAMSFSGVEQYYQLQGRDWERYAMIKARLITGREQDKQQLQSMLTPFVYRRYLDFSMLESDQCADEEQGHGEQYKTGSGRYPRDRVYRPDPAAYPCRSRTGAASTQPDQGADTAGGKELPAPQRGRTADPGLLVPA